MTETPPLATPVADAVSNHWVDRRLPPALRPYARLARWDRPIGWWLLMWPCWWAVALAAKGPGLSFATLEHLLLMWVGSVAMRGAGCTWNDILDRDIDAKVARTRSRPLPSGQVSLKKALAFLGLQALVGLLVLVQFNAFTIWLAMASLGIVAVYPAMKRITGYPQFVLGLAFSWGALVGWSATTGSLSWPPILLYAASILWVIGYDTIYAHQDVDDDAMIGLGSTALSFGDAAKAWLAGLYGSAIALIGAALWLNGSGPLALLGLAGFAAHLGWQVLAFKRDDATVALRLFKSNQTAGAILFAGVILSAI